MLDDILKEHREAFDEMKKDDIGQAHRDNGGKPMMSYVLLGRESIEAEAAVWEFGGKKYGRGNWLKGQAYTGAADSLLRHLTKFLNGEDLDIESGLPHTAHIQTCARILNQSFLTRKDLDDR